LIQWIQQRCRHHGPPHRGHHGHHHHGRHHGHGPHRAHQGWFHHHGLFWQLCCRCLLRHVKHINQVQFLHCKLNQRQKNVSMMMYWQIQDFLWILKLLEVGYSISN